MLAELVKNTLTMRSMGPKKKGSLTFDYKLPSRLRLNEQRSCVECENGEPRIWRVVIILRYIRGFSSVRIGV